MQIDAKLIKELTPINSLNHEHFSDLVKKIKAETIKSGHYIFKKGEIDKIHFYVIKGSIELVDNKKVLKTIKAGTPDALAPIAQNFPRPASARAKGDAIIIKVNSDMLDIMLTWDQTGSYSVEAVESDNDDEATDWMTRILRTRAFHRIPPANIQAMFMRMESVAYKPGDKVITQGEDGDFFYMIQTGRCLVTRATPTNPNGVKLATLSMGDSFGEEALISDNKRNASVTMLSEGNLMRLNKDDFNSLLNEPLLNWVDYSAVKTMLKEGAVLIDARLPDEYKQKHIKGSVNIPLIFLRMKADTLDKNKKHILYCDTGRRSSAASFLLNEKNVESFVLTDGINAVPIEDLDGKAKP
ncbi:MAG: cyclic nucleotide-binding domain-containing protein [Gammaproteobacteria bacterium]|nr:cyclic nucleotide-binding domain-containing protein [Gammaproteobacteria bacterium]